MGRDRSRRRPEQPQRIPHSDPRTELQLQRILGLQQAIARHEDLVSECLQQMAAARVQQDEASRKLRESSSNDRIQAFESAAAANKDRTAAAHKALIAAEEFITARREEVAALAAAMDPVDLACL